MPAANKSARTRAWRKTFDPDGEADLVERTRALLKKCGPKETT